MKRSLSEVEYFIWMMTNALENLPDIDGWVKLEVIEDFIMRMDPNFPFHSLKQTSHRFERKIDHAGVTYLREKIPGRERE